MLVGLIKKLEHLQKRFFRIVAFKLKIAGKFSEAVFKHCDLISLQKISLYLDLYN